MVRTSDESPRGRGPGRERSGLRRFLLSGCLLLVVLTACGGKSRPKAPVGPRFAFGGNLPAAAERLEANPAEPTLPAPTADADLLAVCGVKQGERLTLIREGAVAGEGQVGEILAGWLSGTEGYRRRVFFRPAGLPAGAQPDSIGHVPEAQSAAYDLYVLGGSALAVVAPDSAAQAAAAKILVRGHGQLDAVLEIDGLRYLVLRIWKPDSGFWAYLVYDITSKREPRVVHVDNSWSS